MLALCCRALLFELLFTWAPVFSSSCLNRSAALGFRLRRIPGPLVAEGPSRIIRKIE